MTGEKLKEFESMAVQHADAVDAHNKEISGHENEKATYQGMIDDHRKDAKEYENRISIMTIQYSEQQTLACN